MTTGIQCNVEDAEETMRSLAYSTIEDDQKRFTQLVCFRRDLGRCFDDLKRSRSFVANCAKLPPPIANLVRRSAFGFESSRDPEEKPLDDTQVEMSRGLEPSEMSLEHRQAELERRLDAIKVDLNEEIQVAVGTVQVRDAEGTSHSDSPPNNLDRGTHCTCGNLLAHDPGHRYLRHEHHGD
jgi:hypothetical protein